jgi:hypothetical protein
MTIPEGSTWYEDGLMASNVVMLDGMAAIVLMGWTTMWLRS